MKCCGKAEETEKLIKEAGDKITTEAKVEAKKPSAGATMRQPGGARPVQRDREQPASLPGRSDWKMYDKRNMEVFYNNKNYNMR